MMFTPDSKQLVFHSRLIDVATGKVIRRFMGHSDHVWGLAFTADGATLISGGDHTIRAWDVASGKEKRRYGDETKGALRVLVWVNFTLRHRSDLGNYAENALSFA
jgi:WD40 repeat protein